jgi:sigma-B regulation protein RsbU (phosphoserine phosphatase)
VVSLQNVDEENAFSQEDIDLLMTLTNSMTLSLENARLFDQTKRLLKRLEDEMAIARKTQRSILPSRNPRKNGYEFGSLIMPARAIGGDFFDYIPLNEDRLGIVIGDVSDKGLPAALFMALTFSLLRAESEKSDDPRQILTHVNHYLLKMNALGMFVTLIYAVLDFRSGKLNYARAGHVLPILIDEKGYEIALPMQTGQPLGLFDEMELDVQQAVLPPGGTALFFTDGLNEAGDELGKEFGFSRIVQVLQARQAGSAKSMCKGLWEAVQTHCQGSPHKDDFAALVVKRTGKK